LEEVPAYTGRFNLLPSAIYGQVESWGKIVEHTFGFRSEFAQITALYTSPNFTEWEQRRIEVYAERYDVPVETADLPEPINTYARVFGKSKLGLISI
jgi:hypothetical protein